MRSIANSIEICDSDFYPLEDFPLKWRWTDARWNKLPTEFLERINPLVKEKAGDILQIHRQILIDDFSENKEFISTDLTDFSIVKEWLASKIGADSSHIFVSWDEETALRTTYEIFCKYWNDFCYPVSDDITVSPVNLNWLLIYHHDERFVFGNVKKEII